MKKRFLAMLLVVVMTTMLLPATALAATSSVPFAGGDGTAQNPYQVATAEQLNAVRDELSAHYVLVSDIDLSGDTWIPIGTTNASFSGSFDGSGHTISHLTSGYFNSENYAGLFGYCDTGYICNVHIKDSSIVLTLSDRGINAGGIVGSLGRDGRVEGCTYNGSIQITITGSYGSSVGGIVGWSQGEITSCTNNSNIVVDGVDGYDDAVGGIVGTSYADIENCKNNGNISSDDYAGGIIGTYNSRNRVYPTVSSCSNNGEISAKYAGGITAKASGATIDKCANSGRILSNGSASRAAGIVAYTTDTQIRLCENTADVYSNADTSYNAFAAGIVANAIGTTVISQCRNSGEISASTKHTGSWYDTTPAASASGGGIVSTTSDSTEISDCYNTGKIMASASDAGYGGYYSSKGYAYSGGIAGRDSGVITNCYNMGDIYTYDADYCYEGTIAGSTDGSIEIKNCYFINNPNVSATGDSKATLLSVSGCTDSQLRQQLTYVNFDFSSVWYFDSTGGYPYPQLRGLADDSQIPDVPPDNPNPPINTDPNISNVPKDKYQFHVVDHKGQNLPNVSVIYSDGVDEQTGITNESGLVTFNLFTIGTPEVEATLEDYITWTNRNSNWEKSPNRYETIILYPVGLGEYKLSSCRYSNSSLMTNSTDLLTRTKTVSLGNNAPLAGDLDDGKFYISCKAASDTNVARYELWQGAKKIAETTSILFNGLSSDKFSSGGGCFIRVVAKDGTQVDTNINLQFKKASINKTTSLSISSSKVSFKLGDEIPYVGGQTINISLPISVPITTVVDDNGKIQIGFNINEYGGKTEAEQIQKAKELLSDYRTFSRYNVGEFTPGQKKFFKDITNKAKPFTFFKDGEINVLGYAEADFNSSTAKGQIMIQGKIDACKYGYNTWVWVVPVTVQIKLGLEGDLIGEIEYDWANATLKGGQLDFKPSAELEAFGGIGVDKAIGVGAYGKAKLELLWRILGIPQGVQSVDLTGELGVKAYLAWAEWRKAFAYNTWHLYSANNVRSQSSDEASESAWLSLYDADAYQIHDLDYLEEESEWMGCPIMLLDDSASANLTPLLTDTYRNAQPTLAAADDGLYAAFLRADSTTGDVYVAVTKYSNGAWANPIRVDSTAVMDGTSSLCVDEDGIVWLAYSQTETGYDNTSLLDYAKKQSIVVGSIDPDTLAFTQAASYTGSNYAHLQRIALIDNVPTLVWADSSVSDDDSVLWSTSSNLYTATYTNGQWSSAQLLTSIDQPVLQLAAGTQSGNPAVAYVVDEDGDYNTTEDKNLYCWANGSKVTLAQGIQGKVTYGILPGESQAGFMWNSEGSLQTAGGKSVDAAGITSEYAVTDDRIYYSASDGNGAHLTAVIYDNGTWSLPITMTGGERYLENLSVVQWNNNDYVMGMDTLATITTNEVEDAKNLVWSQVMPTSDLRLDGVDYDAEGVIAGKAVPVTLSVTNTSDHTITSIDVNQNGQVFTKACTLKPGENAELMMSVDCPAALTEYTFSICETGTTDFSPQDNTGSIGIGYADLSVELIDQRIGTQCSLLAYVSNQGATVASGTLCFSDEFGTKLGEQRFEDLEPGCIVVITYPVQDTGEFTATLQCDEDDLYTYNNSASVNNDESSSEEQLVYTITFDPAGGTISMSSLTTGTDGKLSMLPSATRTGYIFDGWYTLNGIKITTNTIFTTNTTIYARWTQNSQNSGNGSSSGGSSSSSGSGSNNSGYSISVPSRVTGGTVTVRPTSAPEGSKVTITAKPNSGYEVGTITVTDKDGKQITVTDAGDNKYIFIMPKSKVDVKVEFVHVRNSFNFIDVQPGAYYYDAVAWAVEKAITAGTSATTFSPDASCTRAQIVTFLWRAAGSPKASVDSPFTDVSVDSYYHDAVLWAVEQGITSGTGANTFSPDTTCTRAQAVTFLYRYEKSPAVSGTNNFSDVDDDAYYADAVQWAVDKNVTAGTSATTFSPNATCTRAQIVTFLYRNMA